MHKRISPRRTRAVIAFAPAHRGLSAAAAPNTAIEYYHAALRSLLHHARCRRRSRRSTPGTLTGWSRTGRGFAVFDLAASRARRQPGLPLLHSAAARRLALLLGVAGGVRGDPRARSASTPTTAATSRKRPTRSSSRCPTRRPARVPPATVPVYRLWNQRADSNHRYTTDPGIKAAMQCEGLRGGRLRPATRSPCARRSALLVDALTPASGASPFAPGLRRRSRAPASSTSTPRSSRRSRSIPANPEQPDRRVAAGSLVQRRRARPRGAAYSFDGGGTWTRTTRADVALHAAAPRPTAAIRARVRPVGHLRARRHRVPGRARASTTCRTATTRSSSRARPTAAARGAPPTTLRRDDARDLQRQGSRSPPIRPTRATSTRCGTG